MQQMIDAGVVVFGSDESFVPKIRTNLFEKTDQVLKSVHFSYAQTTSQQFDAIFNKKRVFDNPKPFQDLGRLIEYLTDEGDLVMDYFAGSGSFGHGAVDVSLRTGLWRPFILVQMPEPVNPKELSGANALELGMATVADIGKERLRRVLRSYKKQYKTLPAESGFRVVNLAPSSFDLWQGSHATNLEELQIAFATAETLLATNWKPEAVLMEVMLMEGFPLDSVMEQASTFKFNDITSFTSDQCGHRLLVCLDKKIKDGTVAVGDLRSDDVFVCLDSGLTDAQKLRLADRCNLKTI
jgi:adenine-specific DNA-methyltransferase